MKRWASHHPVHLLIGLTVWAVWFVIAYGGVSLACRGQPAPGADGVVWIRANVALLLFTLPVVAMLLRAAWACRKAARALPAADASCDRDRFIAATGAALYAAAAFSTAFVALPLLMVPACL